MLLSAEGRCVECFIRAPYLNVLALRIPSSGSILNAMQRGAPPTCY